MFHLMQVVSKQKETDEAVTIGLKLVQENPSKASLLQWLPGQHVRVRLNIHNERVQRSYSISSAKGAPFCITVKRQKGGLVSEFINKTLDIGDTIEVSEPAGAFTLTPDKQKRRSHYFFAAGSGITPCFSMLASVLAEEPYSYVYLLYGNKHPDGIIFNNRLRALQEKYPHKLVVCHSLTSPGWFSSSPWHTGRIDANVVHKFIQAHPPSAHDAYYYICGPEQFIPNVKTALNDIDVPNNRILMERFGAASSPSRSNTEQAIPPDNTHAFKNHDENGQDVAATLDVDLYGVQYQVEVQAGETLLAAMQRNNVAAPFSCEGGVCGACKCHKNRGEVRMHNNLALEQEEVNTGWVLACQSRALTPHIRIQYKD